MYICILVLYVFFHQDFMLQNDKLRERNKNKKRKLYVYERHYIGETMVFEAVIKEIRLHIQDIDAEAGEGAPVKSGAICKSVNDPHTTTFDGT